MGGLARFLRHMLKAQRAQRMDGEYLLPLIEQMPRVVLAQLVLAACQLLVVAAMLRWGRRRRGVSWAYGLTLAVPMVLSQAITLLESIYRGYSAELWLNTAPFLLLLACLYVLSVAGAAWFCPWRERLRWRLLLTCTGLGLVLGVLEYRLLWGTSFVLHELATVDGVLTLLDVSASATAEEILFRMALPWSLAVLFRDPKGRYIWIWMLLSSLGWFVAHISRDFEGVAYFYLTLGLSAVFYSWLTIRFKSVLPAAAFHVTGNLMLTVWVRGY